MCYNTSDIEGNADRPLNFLDRLGAPGRRDPWALGDRTKQASGMLVGVAHATGHRILVVDDEPAIREAVCGYLEMRGHLPLQAADGEEAVEQVRAALPDLVLLDVVTPRMDGIEALAIIRAGSAVPVIMLSARDAEDEKVRALRLGADDYITKPFDQRELVARVEGLLRRSTGSTGMIPDRIVVDEDLTIDFARNRVIRCGREEALTATEHRLLYSLVSNAGRLMSYEALLMRVWGAEYREEVHYVRLYVSYLRAKIEPDLAHPKYILLEKGLGYRFTDLEPRWHPGRAGWQDMLGARLV